MGDFICDVLAYGLGAAIVWTVAYVFCIGVISNYQSRINSVIEPRWHVERAEYEEKMHRSMKTQAKKAGALFMCLFFFCLWAYPILRDDRDPENHYNDVAKMMSAF
jgi:hypothetical protein